MSSSRHFGQGMLSKDFEQLRFEAREFVHGVQEQSGFRERLADIKVPKGVGDDEPLPSLPTLRRMLASEFSEDKRNPHTEDGLPSTEPKVSVYSFPVDLENRLINPGDEFLWEVQSYIGQLEALSLDALCGAQWGARALHLALTDDGVVRLPSGPPHPFWVIDEPIDVQVPRSDQRLLSDREFGRLLNDLDRAKEILGRAQVEPAWERFRAGRIAHVLSLATTRDVRLHESVADNLRRVAPTMRRLGRSRPATWAAGTDYVTQRLIDPGRSVSKPQATARFRTCALLNQAVNRSRDASSPLEATDRPFVSDARSGSGYWTNRANELDNAAKFVTLRLVGRRRRLVV